MVTLILMIRIIKNRRNGYIDNYNKKKLRNRYIDNDNNKTEK